MKVVVNSRFLCQPLTGIQRFAIEISIRLKKILGDQIQFVTPSDIKQIEVAQQLNAQIIGKHHGQVWEQWDLLKYLKKEGSPLLLCLSGGAPIFYKNLLFTLHDIVYVKFPDSYSFSYRKFYGIIIPKILKNAKKIITVSEFSKNEISTHYEINKEKIEVVYNAVDEKFRPILNSYSDFYHSKIEDQKYFLAVSSPAFHKNFDFLVKAYLYSTINKNAQLFIVGKLDSDLYKNSPLFSQLTQHPNVKLLGRVSDENLIELYSHALAFVFPSLYEGFGIPPLEAQFCGCMVLSSNAASMPEVLGNSVLYFDPKNIEKLQELLENVYKNKDQLNSELEGDTKINLKKYNWNVSARKIANFILEN